MTGGRPGLPSTRWTHYAWAVVAIVLAVAARRFADPRLGTQQLPYGSVLVAAMIIAWFGGLRPALVVVFVGGAAANFFLQVPRLSFEPGPDQQSWGFVVFLVLGSVISMFGGFVRTQRARAEATAELISRGELALRVAHDGLERRVAERTAELARINESLRASEERFRLLVEGVRGYAMVMVDAAGVIVAWNAGAARLFGRSAEVVGAPLTALIPGLELAQLGELAQAGASEHHAVRDAAAFPIELEITKLAPQALYVGIVRDISERKRLEALTEQKQRKTDELRRKADELEADNRRMQDAARLQSQFLANMSHELRTPLNAIIGFADLMYTGTTGPLGDTQREFLGDILISSRHLLQLINDVLDHAKVESGTLELAPQPIDLARVIGEVRDILRGIAATRQIELQLQLQAALGSVTVDPAKLRQILYNYVSNALKFTPAGGRVTIRASLTDAAGEAFRVEVEDTGIGIASDDLRYLFVAFRQLDVGAAKRYQGTGLGLALSKRLAEAHGGQVGVRSAPGAGSTFWVELPRIVASAPAALRAARR